MTDDVYEYLDLDRETVEGLDDWNINLRDHMDGSGISAGKNAMKSAIAEAFQAHEAPIGSHIVPKLETDGYRSNRINGSRLSLKEVAGYGERTHRAIRSRTVSAQKLREKVLELAEEEMAAVERYEAKKRRKEERRRRKEAIEAELKSVAEELGLQDPDRPYFGSVTDYSFGPDGNMRLKARAKSNGISLSLEGLTGDELKAIVDMLS